MATIRLHFEEGKQPTLPPVCARCGLPATEVQTRQFRWTPPWAKAAGTLLGSWVAVVGTLTREVPLPLCAEHADRRRDWEARRRQYLLLYLPAVVALVLVLVAKVLYQGLDAVLREGPVAGLGLPLLAAVLVFLVTWPFVVAWAKSAAIRPVEITADSITLAGVSEEFARRVQVSRGEGEPGQAFGAPAPPAKAQDRGVIQLPDGTLLIPVTPGSPGGRDGSAYTEMGPDHPDYDHWFGAAEPGEDPRSRAGGGR